MATKKSVKKESKSRYVTRTYTLPDGTRKYVYGKTVAEAEAKIAEVKALTEKGINVQDTTTFGELAKIWLEKYKAPYVKASSVYTIRIMLNSQAMPMLAPYKVRDINGALIRTWFGKVVAGGFVRSATLLTYVRDIFNAGVELGCIDKNPVPLTLRAPGQKKTVDKEKEVLPAALEIELMERLPAYTPERLFFVIGRYTGLRRGEIFALNWDSIDLEAGVIVVRRNLASDEEGHSYFANSVKSETSLRELPIPMPLLNELQSWYARFGCTTTAGLKTKVAFGADGYLFCHNGGIPYTMQNLQTVWNRVRKIAGEVDPDYAKKFTPHVLRHTFITRLFERGLDIKEVQYLAGHSDAQTTLNVYTHFDKAARRDDTFGKVRGAMDERPKTQFRVV